MQCLQRVQTVARLGIGQVKTGFDPEPEIGEFIGKGALLVHIFLVQIARTHNKGFGMLVQQLQKHHQVLGIVLAVRIDADGIAVAFLPGKAKALLKGMPLAPVFRIAEHLYIRELRQNRQRGIGAAVVNHHNVVTIATHILQNRPQKLSIVVGGNQHTALVLRKQGGQRPS